MKRMLALLVLLAVLLTPLCQAESVQYTEDELKSMRKDYLTEADDNLIWSDGAFTVKLRRWPGYYIEQLGGVLYHEFYNMAMRGPSAGAYIIFTQSADDMESILNYDYTLAANALLSDVSSFELVTVDGYPGAIAFGDYGGYDTGLLCVINGPDLLAVLMTNSEASASENREHMEKLAAGIVIENHLEPVDFDYKSVSRNPDKYNGTHCSLKGEVLQVLESEDSDHPGNYFADYRVALDDAYNEIVYLSYYRIKGESRILEGDMVTINGICRGLFTYTTVLGNDVIVPLIYVETVTFEE